MAISTVGIQAIVTLCLSFAFVAPAAQSTPIEKVLDLLDDLEVQLTKEGKEEATNYDKYACFCKEQADDKLYAIETSEAKVEALGAKIKQLTTEITELDSAVGALGKEISEAEKKVKDATAARDKEHEEYLKTSQDRKDAIEYVAGAIEAIKAAKADMKGDTKLNLAQAKAVVKKFAPFEVNLLAKLEQVPASGAPHDYTFQSNGVLEALQNISAIFKANLAKVEEDEANAKQAYDLNVNALSNTIKFKQEEKKEKEEISAAKTEEKEAAVEENTEETADMEADKEFMTVLKKDCEEKAGLWDQRSKSRADELTAINTAVAALKEKVAPNWSANKLLSDLQKAKKRPMSFLQIRGSSKSGDSIVQEVQRLLTNQARRLSSATLTSAALRVMASKDHFVKVRGLIKDLIATLEASAAAEADTKSACDKEMKGATGKRDTASSDTESSTAVIAKLSAENAQLTSDIATLTSEISSLAKELKEATELREEEKAENEKTIAMAKEAIEGVNFAITTLRDYYSFIQGKYTPPMADREGKTVEDLSPEIFDSDYKGAQVASKGIFGLLDVIQSDFIRTQTSTEADEKAAAADFEKLTAQIDAAISNKKGMIKSKESTIADNKVKLTDEDADLSDAEKLHSTSLETLEVLKVKCVDQPGTYKGRVEKRKEEIEALKQAMQILIDWQKPSEE